jgi:hypothetical protein
MGLGDIAKKCGDCETEKKSVLADYASAGKPELTRMERKREEAKNTKCVWMSDRGCVEGNHMRIGDCIGCLDYIPHGKATFKQKIMAENKNR